MEKVGGIRVAVLGTRGLPSVQGGVESHCEKLYPRLAASGCRVRVYARKGYVRPHGYEFGGVDVLPLWTSRRKNLEAFLHTLLGVLHAAHDRKDIDLLHIHAVGPSLMVPLARLMGLKVVVTNHGPDYERQKWGRIARTALRLGERLGTNYADGVICVSRNIKRGLEARFKREVDYIPNGVDIPDFVKPGGYLESLGVLPGRYVLAVGRFVPEKGFHDLLEAFRGVDTDWRLVIAGDGDHEDEYVRSLKAAAGRDPRVVLAGMIKGERLGEVYSNAALFVLPSYHEGLPIALLEALSYGLKVLCSSIPANMEVVSDAPSLFSPGDVAGLRDRLAHAVEQPCGDAVSPDARKEKLKEYDWDEITRKTLAVYQGIIS